MKHVRNNQPLLQLVQFDKHCTVEYGTNHIISWANQNLAIKMGTWVYMGTHITDFESSTTKEI